MKPLNALLATSTLSTLAIFIALPLFGLHAAEHFMLSASEIGVLMAIWPATVFCLSFFCGIAADRLGYLTAIRIALTLNTLSFLALALSQNVVQFGIGLLFFGVGKSFFDSSMRAAIAVSSTPAEREKCFRLRSMLQNMACVIGPLIGVVAYKYIVGVSFGVSAFVFAIGLSITALMLKTETFKSALGTAVTVNWAERFKVLRDPSLLLFIGGGTLILAAYGCYEALMPVIVTRSAGTRPDFGYLVSINAIAVILFQIVHMRWLSQMSLRASMITGFVLLVAGFLLFTVDTFAFIATIIATIIFSIGEAILFPCLELLLNEAAPQNNRAAYFGAGELKQVGFFLGPLVGGWLLESGGSTMMFGGCAVGIVFASVCTAQMRLRSQAAAL